jgi:pyruvate dehydrogenase E2 component (dihydrolipoamide acetyltransferase)
VVVGVKDGIVIPVIFSAHTKSLAQIAKDWENLSKKASEGSLKLEEITGGTITISNVGNVGIDVFTPILNPPESAVLGITRTRQKPIVKEGQITIGDMAYLCLTGDHRVMDAEPIGQFLMGLEKILQNPSILLL